MPAPKARVVATFELLSTVKRPGYLITTFGMPVFLALYAAIVSLPAYFVDRDDRPLIVGVVDHAGVLTLGQDEVRRAGDVSEQLPEMLQGPAGPDSLEDDQEASRVVFRPFPSEADAQEALIARNVRGFFVVPADYLQHGTVEAYSPDTFMMRQSTAREALADLLRERLIGGRLDEAIAERVREPMAETRRFAVTDAGEVRDGGPAAMAVRVVVPLAFMALLLLSILMTAGYLIQGTATEKENKVVEVLLASASPNEILLGKLAGLGAAGLLQILVWLAILMGLGVGLVPLLVATGIDMPWRAAVLALPFFLVTYLFFGSLMLGTGALGSNMRETQQYSMMWSLSAAVPLILLAPLLSEPHGLVARTLTWIPFTSAPVVVLRASLDPAALLWWEVAGAFGVLVLATWGALALGARLFRVGLISAGRPRLREILRQASLNQ